MIRHTKTPQTDPVDKKAARKAAENETAIAKARLRIAALQVTPMDVVREHPWASVIGTSAAALTLAALVGGPPKTKIIYRDRDPDGKIHESHAKEKPSGGLMAILSTGLLTKLINAGVQMAQAHMQQNSPSATNGAHGRMNGESGDAMG